MYHQVPPGIPMTNSHHHAWPSDLYAAAQQCTTGIPSKTSVPCQSVLQNPWCSTQTMPEQACSTKQCCIDQFYGQTPVPINTPIFILTGCHQTETAQQRPQQQPNLAAPQIIPQIIPQAYFSNALSMPCYQPTMNYPPPPLYTYPVPYPIYEPMTMPPRHRINKDHNCNCFPRDGLTDLCNRACGIALDTDQQRQPHDAEATICCSKKNCLSMINLQALVAQLLAVQGVIACTATRLILRKIPGSNVFTSVDDAVDRARNSIAALSKTQLTAEARNALQVTALINLHIATNPPTNILPILTMVQLKVNLLKAQVENLMNAKVMEFQDACYEAGSGSTINTTRLSMKSDAELRELSTQLRQRECDERVNVNFSPYRSQRAYAEIRLKNVQEQIRQVEKEFNERRFATGGKTAPSLSERIVQEFSEAKLSPFFGYPGTCNVSLYTSRAEDMRFTVRPSCPKRLNIVPHVGSPRTSYSRTSSFNSSKTERPGTSRGKSYSEETNVQSGGQKNNSKEPEKSVVPEPEKSLVPEPEKGGSIEAENTFQTGSTENSDPPTDCGPTKCSTECSMNVPTDCEIRNPTEGKKNCLAECRSGVTNLLETSTSGVDGVPGNSEIKEKLTSPGRMSLGSVYDESEVIIARDKED